jgi:hypothetical protein
MYRAPTSKKDAQKRGWGAEASFGGEKAAASRRTPKKPARSPAFTKRGCRLAVMIGDFQSRGNFPSFAGCRLGVAKTSILGTCPVRRLTRS